MVIAFVVVMIALAILWWRSGEPKNEPPMMKGALPFIGHAHYVIGNAQNLWFILSKLAEKSLQVGHPVSIKLGNMKVYVLSDPDDCFAVTQASVDKPKLMYEFTKDILGTGLMCSKQLIWSRHRKLMNPMFNPRVLQGFIGILNTTAKCLVSHLETVEGKGFFNSVAFFQNVAIKSTLSTLTGTDPYNDDEIVQKYIRTLNSCMEIGLERVTKISHYLDSLLYSWTNVKIIQESNAKILRDEARKLLHQRKQFLLGPSKGNTNAFIDLLLQFENNGLSEAEIVDEINTIILTSYDTSALLLTYTLATVGSYPEVQERIYQEIEENILNKGDNGYEIKKEHLSKLVYLEAVIKETIRIHTIIPIISRYLDKNIKNYTLYKGNECIILVNALHRHPMWGNDVSEFKPERWLKPELTSKDPHVFAGFGHGRRNCIGKAYAMMQSKIMLAHVLMNYRVVGDHTKISYKYQFVLEPESGHHISIVKRRTE